MATDTQREELIAELARGLAHEIKNPLSTLSMNLQLLKEEWQDQPEPGQRERRSLDKIDLLQRETHRLKEIVDDFLHYARPPEAHYTKLSLWAILEEVLDFLAPSIARQKVRLLKTEPAEPITAMVDRDLIKQVFLNILLNALDAMPDGGDLLVRAAASEGEAKIDLSNTGEGIPSDRIERLFDVYYSTKKGGSGLGLPTARKIIDLHGGTIEVQSDMTQGTNFRIILPTAD